MVQQLCKAVTGVNGLTREVAPYGHPAKHQGNLSPQFDIYVLPQECPVEDQEPPVIQAHRCRGKGAATVRKRKRQVELSTATAAANSSAGAGAIVTWMTAMRSKRLIPDAFPAVKRPRRDCAAKAPGAGPAEEPRAAPAPAPLDLLKRFDLSPEYGPCTGITRLQRWERAAALGLSPPDAVREALLQHGEDPRVTYSLWHEYPL
ncbi:DNA polymerase delta subunit 4 isoform B [Alligator mississippiensis]|uniref:DNA polymerase delta subunit 4 isoform B n=1 Tax=Alligator mississippiensis TaxID=8496 RepID=A0A151MU90_ALLMI|nr:DNA polymerase delta subunit 4 isoform B [Alligator mississippiensis]